MSTAAKFYVMKNHRASDTTLNYILWSVSASETKEATVPLTPDCAKQLFVHVLGAQLVSPGQAFELGLIGNKEQVKP